MLQPDEIGNLHAPHAQELRKENRTQDGARTSARKHWKTFYIVIGLVALAAVWLLARWHGGGDKKAPENPPVPVVAGTVKKQDVPIYLDGLGTVQAYNTVTVHVRVDGQLVKVAYGE